MAKLEVEFGADITELKTKLAEAQVLLENLKRQKSNNVKLGLDTVNLQSQINDAKANITSLTSQINSNSSALDNHSRATANGGNTLMQFSRIAQDAPFGIIGIGNNLTATAESFGHLAKSSGGAGNALKAVGASLLGPGGVLLAISLVTTGLTLMAQKGLTISDVFQMLSGSFDQAGRDIKKAYEESSKSALGEVASIKAVIAVAQDEKISRKERLQAVNDLQSKYPAYFGNLSKEQILYGDLSKEIKNVSQALINKALAEKISEKAGDAAFKQLQLNAQLIKGKETLKRAEENLQNAVTNGASSQALATYSNELNRAKTNLQEIRNEVLKNNKVLDRFDSILKKTSQSEIAGNAAESDVKTQIDNAKKVADAKARAEAAAAKKAAKIAADAANRTNPEITNNLKAADLVGLDDKEFQLAKDRIDRDGTLIKTYGKAGEFVKGSLIAARQSVSAETVAMMTILAQFNDAATNIINSSISNTFASLGEAIGSAMATGGNVLKAAGNALLAGLGGILTEMGKMAIQVGVGMLGIKAALKTLNPYAAIAAGVALVALGSVFSSKSKSLGNSMGGGSSTTIGTGVGGGSGQRGAISTGADVSSPTSSVSSGGTFNNSGGTVVFEIAGQKLIGVLNNTTQGNLRLGGSGLVG
jgi:hypothetical protein